jgi:ABC-type transporter lipoprotein component MlaA
VLPVLGCSTLRDVTGKVADGAQRVKRTKALKLKLSILAQGSKDSNVLYGAVDKDKRIKNNRQQQGIWVYLFHHYNI